MQNKISKNISIAFVEILKNILIAFAIILFVLAVFAIIVGPIILILQAGFENPWFFLFLLPLGSVYGGLLMTLTEINNNKRILAKEAATKAVKELIRQEKRN